jgi:hypothetical protein
MSTDQTFTDRVAALFKSMPGQWIDARVIAQVGGFAAWRTRISNARIAYGMDIRNRTRWEETPIGGFTVSEQVGGFAAWRTRISECRQRGMPDIRNRQRVEDTPIGSYKVTEYCYFPEPQPRALDEAEDQPLPWEAA